MGQINIAVNENRKAGVQRIVKHNPKTDMTPMVDLGFLLIAFFVFTAEINKPTTMNLYMPKDDIPTPSFESRSITFLIERNNRLYYYLGTEENAIKNDLVSSISYDEKTGIGKMIREKQFQLENSGIDKKELVVLLKPAKESTYKNAVDALDEMTINGVTRYAIVKAGKWDMQYLEKHQ